MARAPFRFTWNRQVTDALREAPQEIEAEFLTLLEALERNPKPVPKSLLRIMEFKDPSSLRGGFTAPFDDGLLLYQVMADYPIVKLVQVTWVD
jgi:hypothetical protein